MRLSHGSNALFRQAFIPVLHLQCPQKSRPAADEKDILATMTRALESCLGFEERKDTWKKVSSKCGSLPLSLAMTLWLRINHPKAADTVAAEVCLANRATRLAQKVTKIEVTTKFG